MKMCMKIEIKEDKAYVFTPYNPDFVKKIKGIGGAKWSGQDRCWKVPADTVDAVRNMMMDVYGESDITDDSDKVTVEIEFEDEVSERCAPVVIFGKVVARAFGRDSGARVGNDAVFVKGNPISDGSVKNWYTTIPVGCVVRLRGVPKTALTDEYKYTVVDDTRINKTALEEEKERLLKRLAEIEELLNS